VVEAPLAAVAFVLGRLGIVADDVPLDAAPAVAETSMRVGAATVGRVGAATVDDPDVVAATLVGVGRTGAIAVAAAGDPVATGLGAVAVVGVPPGCVAAGATVAAGFVAGFAFGCEARAVRDAFGQRAALRARRALLCCFAHAAEREADFARA
jgi:hypothetical protein